MNMDNITHKAQWIDTNEGRTYVLEALDSKNAVIASVKLSVDWDTSYNFNSIHGNYGWNEIEKSAESHLSRLLETLSKDNKDNKE